MNFSTDNYEIELALKCINNCPICRRTKLVMIGHTNTINPNSDMRIEVIKCENCLHWFINPMVKQAYLNFLYKKASEYVVSKDWEKTEFNIPELYIIKNESKNSTIKKYLEIGVGSGLLFNYFRQIGYDCYGVEPGNWPIRIPNVVQGIDDLNENNFDVIILVDVIEHLEDPVILVKKISKVINTGGTVYASFPNCQSLRAYLFKERWRMIRPFGHLHFFSKKSLAILFESNGFKIKHLLKTDLLEFKLKRFFNFPYVIARLVNFFGQSLWGDQWIVRLIKN